MADDVKTLTRRMLDVLNAGDIDGLDDLVDEKFVEHEELPGFAPDREGVKQFFIMLRSAFEGFRMDIDDLYADGDTAIARVTARGTHVGEFMGVPASGATVAAPLIDILRFQDGKAIEHWGVMDMMTLMQQIGAIPE